MIKKLRGRFIRVAMLSVVLVLFVIMGAINILNYRNVVQESDAILTVLAENGGSFPGMGQGGPGMQDGSLPPDGLPDDAGGAADETIETAEGTLGERPELPPDGFDREDREDFSELFPAFGMRGISEETPFESRWFSVTMSADGEASDSDISNIASVDSEKAAEYAAEVYGTGRTKGFKDSYRYLRTDKEDGTATLLFLDCQRSLANFRSFLWISILVSAIGIAAVFVLVVLLSKRVTRPVQESYEKQRQFITDAGHELKTPLTIIDADVSVLEMDLGENEWLDDVKVQTNRLTGLTTDLIYQPEELLKRPYYYSCGMSKYLALIIDTMNHDGSVSDLLDPFDRIDNYLAKQGVRKKKK